MTYFFSRVRLQRRPKDMRRFAELSRYGDAYRDHALIWRLFPGDDQVRDFVYRRDMDEFGTLSYFVVSKREPSVEPSLLDVQTKIYQPRLAVDDRLRFDLRANPTISHRVDGKASRHDVLMDVKRNTSDIDNRSEAMDEAALMWLRKRAPQWGLELDDKILVLNYAQHRLLNKGRRIEFSSLDYRGVARITDPLLLEQALLHGVGHARGFGCGLLLIKRIA